MRGEFLRVLKHDATTCALIRPGQSLHTVGPLIGDLVKLIAAADRAGERDVQADHICIRIQYNVGHLSICSASVC